jgi:hypothetical protein
VIILRKLGQQLLGLPMFRLKEKHPLERPSRLL